MRVLGGRTFGVVFLAVVGGAAVSHELLACEHERDCNPNPNPVAIEALPGYQQSRVKQINNRGDIVGQAVRTTEEPTQQAVLWHKVRGSRRKAEALPGLEGFSRTDARGFASDRIPVGFAFLPATGSTRAVAWGMDWTTGLRTATDLEPPPGFTDALALSGSASGLVAGEASNPKELVGGISLRHAVLWHLGWDGGSTVCDLGVPDGFLTSSANSVNARGLVVGTARGRSAEGSLLTAGFVWRPHGRMGGCRFEAIPLPSGEMAFTVLTPAINERGDVVAQGSAGSSIRALFWRSHRDDYADPEILPLPDGFTDALARAINEPGDVVGTAQRRTSAGTEARVVLWKRSVRGWTVQVLTSPADTNIINSEYLNDRGDVIADTTVPAPGASGAYLWIGATRPACRAHSGRGDLDEPADGPKFESSGDHTP